MLWCFQMALKWADIGHLASPREVHLKWVKRLEEEMFIQGDMERVNGLPISPLMDRLKGQGITKSQTGVRGVSALNLFGPRFRPVFLCCHNATDYSSSSLHSYQFFNFVAMPTYIPMAQAFAGCTPVLEAVKSNYQYWAEVEAAAAAAAAASAGL